MTKQAETNLIVSVFGKETKKKEKKKERKIKTERLFLRQDKTVCKSSANVAPLRAVSKQLFYMNTNLHVFDDVIIHSVSVNTFSVVVQHPSVLFPGPI